MDELEETFQKTDMENDLNIANVNRNPIKNSLKENSITQNIVQINNEHLQDVPNEKNRKLSSSCLDEQDTENLAPIKSQDLISNEKEQINNSPILNSAVNICVHKQNDIIINKVQLVSDIEISEELINSKTSVSDTVIDDYLTASESTDNVENQFVEKQNENINTKITNTENENDEKCKEQTQITENLECNDKENINDSPTVICRKGKRLAFIDSDSDEEASSEKEKDNLVEGDNNLVEGDNSNNTQSRIRALIDSESEEEDSLPIKESHDSIIEAEEDMLNMKSSLANICDSESSADERVDDDDDSKTQAVPYKKKFKKKEETGIKKMTAKDAMEQRKEIDSESQRMMRERHVSLPYHKPKQRSLKEFLTQRPKFATAIPITARAPNVSMAIKMSSQLLETMSKNLESREKTVEDFFKSDSESEDESFQIDHDDEQTGNIPPSNTDDVENLPAGQTNEAEKGVDSLIIEKPHIEESEVEPEIIHNNKETSNDYEMKDTIESEECVNANQKEIGEGSLEMQNNIDNTILQVKDTSVMEKNGSIVTEDENIIHKVIDNSIENESEPHHGEEAVNDTMMEKNNEIKANIAHVEKTDGDTELNPPESTNKNDTHESMDYEFNLDDVDQLDDDVLDDGVKIDQIMKKFSAQANLIDEEEADKAKMKKVESIQQKLGDMKPCLSGGPNLVIDLDEGVIKPNQITQLMERFIKHTSKKPSHKNEVKLSIISVTKDQEIHKENVAIKVEEAEEPPVFEKPGIQLMKLKNELELQMAQRRAEAWKQKNNLQNEQTNSDDNVYDGEKSECGAEDDILDIDEEEEITDSESESDEKDEKHEFFEEEAEEDLVEETQESDEEEGDDENAVEKDCDDEDSCEENEHEFKTPKKLKRIVMYDDGSEDEADQLNDKETHLDTTDSWDDECPPAGQVIKRTPKRQISEKSEMGFLSPVCHLTALQGLNSGSKYTSESPNSPALITHADPSPLKEHSWQKKLFSEDLNTEGTLDELADLCSGKFPSQTQQLITSQDEPQELLDFANPALEIDKNTNKLCSKLIDNNAKPIETPNIRILENIVVSSNTQIKNLNDDQEDRLITQLLNEEEMEKFKKKFDSPIINENVAKVQVTNPSLASKIQFDSSDEDVDDDDDEIVIKKKKNLTVIDDSDEDESIIYDEEIDLHDELEQETEKNDTDEENNEVQDVEYDSEENEIDKSEIPKKKLKVSDFVEHEAELSESEWGSDDEDEKDMDRLDIELGDSEKYDEKKVRSELERIHMRRLLDDDAHEVKILQELLLDDGELHGAGRERQFRWKNIDNENKESEVNRGEEDCEGAVDEEDDEEQWRKKRYEREVFLKTQMKSSVEEDSVNITLSVSSPILKFGQQVVIKSANTPPAVSQKPAVPTAKSSFLVANKRGSFLSRSDKVLTRMAEISKISSSSGHGGVQKNSRNFLFQMKDVESSTSSDTADKKRKSADDRTNKPMKKLRLNNFTSIS